MTQATKPIWSRKFSLSDLNARAKNTIHESLGIVFTGIGDDYLEATMPVDPRTHQPMGLLHGGASVVLAESLGSSGASLVAGEGKACVGIDIHACHLTGMRQGTVLGKATPVRLGKSIQVWRIVIVNEGTREEKVCEATLTVFVK